MEKKLDFKTVKKLTRQGSYTINVHLESLKDTIDRYIEKHKLQMNPEFQRGHVWTENQQIKFVEFILRGGKSQPICFNHNDWMTFSRKDSEMFCVDGLQRTTALLKFLDNKLPVFGGYILSEFENFSLWNFDVEININNLKTREEVLQWYLDMNSGGTQHTKEELEKVKLLLK